MMENELEKIKFKYHLLPPTTTTTQDNNQSHRAQLSLESNQQYTNSYQGSTIAGATQGLNMTTLPFLNNHYQAEALGALSNRNQSIVSFGGGDNLPE